MAYLVSDDRRAQIWHQLETEVGLTPREILDCPPPRLATVIAAGGMLAEHRAAKLHRCAEVAVERFEGELSALPRLPSAQIRRELRRYPSIGNGADKILLLARIEPVLALDSNGLRVLLRLGYGEEVENYDRTYRSAQTAAIQELPQTFEALIDAHLLLRHHGAVICRRSAPACDSCPLFRDCPRKGLALQPPEISC